MLGRAVAVGADVDEAASSSNRSGAAVEVTAGAAQSSSVAAAAAAAAANGAASLALPDVLAEDWTVPVPAAAAGADENTSYDFSLKVLSVMSVIRVVSIDYAARKMMFDAAVSATAAAAAEEDFDPADDDELSLTFMRILYKLPCRAISSAARWRATGWSWGMEGRSHLVGGRAAP